MGNSQYRFILLQFFLTGISKSLGKYDHCKGPLSVFVPSHLCVAKTLVNKIQHGEGVQNNGKASGTGYTDGNADYAVDVVIRNFKSIVPEQQSIPDLGTWFNLRHCSLNGLQSGLSRSGHSLFRIKEDTMILEGHLQAKDLKVRCSWSKDFGLFTKYGKAIGTSRIVTIKAYLSFDLKPGAVPLLKSFEVVEMSPIKTEITGIGGAFGWIAEQIADPLIAKSAHQIRSTISKETKDVLQEQLNELFGYSSASRCV